jgi:hypothetical protein
MPTAGNPVLKVRVEEDFKAACVAKAERTGTDISKIMRDALTNWLAQSEETEMTNTTAPADSRIAVGKHYYTPDLGFGESWGIVTESNWSTGEATIEWRDANGKVQHGRPIHYSSSDIGMLFREAWAVVSDKPLTPGEPFVGMPATITLSSDRMAAVVIRVNKRGGKVSSVTVRRVAIDESTEWQINSKAEPYPFLAWRGVLDQFVSEHTERFAFNGFKYRGVGDSSGCGLILGRSFSARDYRA